MFTNSDLIKQENLETLSSIGKLHLSPLTGTTRLVKKLGEFNLNLTIPSLFNNLLATPDKLKLGNLILFSPPEEREPILCVDYEVSFAESKLKTASGVKLILDIKNEINLIEYPFKSIKDYEAYLYLKNNEAALKKLTEPLNKPTSDGAYLEGIMDSLNNIIDNKNKDEN